MSRGQQFGPWEQQLARQVHGRRSLDVDHFSPAGGVLCDKYYPYDENISEIARHTEAGGKLRWATKRR